MIDTDNRFSYDISFNENVMISMPFIIKFSNKCYPQLFLEEAVTSQNWWEVVKLVQAL